MTAAGGGPLTQLPAAQYRCKCRADIKLSQNRASRTQQKRKKERKKDGMMIMMMMMMRKMKNKEQKMEKTEGAVTAAT
jgi:hypothetical protein